MRPDTARMMPKHCVLSLLCAVALVGAPGCVDELVVGSLVGTKRRSQGGLETLHDFDVARQASESHLGEIEGLYRLDPDSDDALYLLTRSWTLHALIFVLDAEDRATAAGNAAGAAYQRDRARAALLRARSYGALLMERLSSDYEQASKNTRTFGAWLASEFTDVEDADVLLWVGLAYGARALLAPTGANESDDRRIGRELVARSVALHPDLMHGAGELALGIEAAVSRPPDLARAGARIDRALATSQGRFLLSRVVKALAWECARGDGAAARSTLRTVVEGGDVLPEARLYNLAAIRRAQRRLTRPESLDSCPVAARISSPRAKKP